MVFLCKKVCQLRLLLLCHALAYVSTFAHGQYVISGTITDKISKSPLPYSTVFLKNSSFGTLANDEGKFRLLLPQEKWNDTFSIESLGYLDLNLLLQDSTKELLIEMEPSVSQLQEITVLPMPPTFYIQRAVRGLQDIRPTQAYQTEGFYVEKITENDQYIRYDEGIFKSYNPKFRDSIRRQYQLVLYRQGATIHPMKFMLDERQKMEEKEHKKKDSKREALSGIDFVFTSGGPVVMMHYATINPRADDYIDSNDFKNFNYNFVASTSDADKELMQIDFESKGVVEHVRLQGRIFIHLPTNAIVKIEARGNFVIPVLLRPLMFLYGFSAKDLSFDGRKEYQMINGKWYFKSALLNAHVTVTKKHWFSANEHAEYKGSQSYSILKIWEQESKQIAPSKRYDPNKLMKVQVFPETGFQWTDWHP